MPSPFLKPFPVSLFLLLVILCYATPAHAFGAGFVARGSSLKGSHFRHGDILLAIPFLETANRRMVKKIYFGNWLRDFSQILDTRSLALVPEPILRALVAVFGFVQFGYSTREFEVTQERLGFYRPEEHIDNPRGYHDGHEAVEDLRAEAPAVEHELDSSSGMKKYVSNSKDVAAKPSSADYVETELVAAIACARQGNPEAYLHLGAALHTLEDFVAHSNWVELCMQMIGRGLLDQGPPITPAMAEVFTFVGDGAIISTKRGPAPPLVTGTFGALDLYQTLLGEIDDKLAAMSLPGLQLRTAEKGGALQGLVKTLIGLLNGAGSPFESRVLKLQKAASNPTPADWGKLNEAPDKLWEQLEPVFRLRDDIVKWVYDHLTVRAVQDAIAAISTALDKLVYLVIGIFLGPVLAEISKALQEQEEELAIKDMHARTSVGEKSIFEKGSRAMDPTHSQLAKDHYDHELNEIAGRVATVVSTYTITSIASIWQPQPSPAASGANPNQSNPGGPSTATTSSTDPVKPVLSSILSALHHPYNSTPGPTSELQTLMFAEVFDYCESAYKTDPKAFESRLNRLSRPYLESRLGEANSHVVSKIPAFLPMAPAYNLLGVACKPLSQAASSLAYPDPSPDRNTDHARRREFHAAMTNAYAPKSQWSKTTAHDLVTEGPVTYVDTSLIERITENLTNATKGGLLPDLKLGDIGSIKDAFLSEPSGGAPNPLDAGLSFKGLGGVGLTAAFKDVSINELAQARGMGEVLRDAVITMRVMEMEKVEMEQEIGADGDFEGERNIHFGVCGRDGNWFWDKRAMKEMQRLLDIERGEYRRDEDEGKEEKRSGMGRMKEGFSKLKMKMNN